MCALEFAIPGGDGADARAAARGEGENFVAGMNDTGGNLAGEAAKILMRAQNALHRKPEASMRALDGERHGLKKFQKARPVVPGHSLAAVDDVVAIESADRDCDQFRNLESAGEIEQAVR